MEEITILNKSYDGEGIADMARDIHEMWDERFNPQISSVKCDEHGIAKGNFKVLITWLDD